MGGSTPKHLPGDRFGSLVLIERLPRQANGGSVRAVFRCDCGGTKEAQLNNVVSGGVVHCGNRDEHPGHNWKGNGDLTYDGAHGRVKAKCGSASAQSCVGCGGRAEQWAYSHADPGERRQATGREAGRPYSVHPDHYEPRCRRCHRRWDDAERRLTRGHPKGTTSLVHFTLFWARRGGIIGGAPEAVA